MKKRWIIWSSLTYTVLQVRFHIYPSTSIPSLAVACECHGHRRQVILIFLSWMYKFSRGKHSLLFHSRGLERDPVGGRLTCRSHGRRMTRQLSDHWWQAPEPGWHTGPLIVRLLMCLYQLNVCRQTAESSLWSLNRWQRGRCVYCHHLAQNMCLL